MPGIIYPNTCPDCENTGMREIKNPIPALVYCSCAAGRALREQNRERDARDWKAAKDEGLWDHPEHWPW